MLMPEVEIITDGGCRRRWSAAEKQRTVKETLYDGESISAAACRNGAAPNLLRLSHYSTYARMARERLEAFVGDPQPTRPMPCEPNPGQNTADVVVKPVT